LIGWAVSVYRDAMNRIVKVSTRTLRKVRGGEVRTYESPAVYLAGGVLDDAGIEAGDTLSVVSARGVVTLRKAQTKKKS